MRNLLLLSLAALSSAAAFQTAPFRPTRLRTTRLLDEPLAEQSHDAPKKLILPSKNVGLLSKLTTSQLSALTTLKKDERRAFNKRRLLQLGVTMSALLLCKSNVANAATPLVVAGGAVTPLIAAPGMGIVAMPGVQGPYQVVGGVANRGAMFFALALFVSTALLRAAGGGHGKLVHFLLKHLETEKEGEDIELRLPTETSWDAYASTRVDPLKKRPEAGSVGSYAFNKFTMLFEKAKSRFEENHGAEEAKLEQANKHFREQQFKQHHHPVHVARSKFEQASYLDSLPVNEEGHHDMPQGYLDTLSSKKSSWDAYKHKLEDAKPVTEVDELKEEVNTLQNLMQIEQSMYQASNHALKLAMEAQGGELQHSSSNDELKDFDAKLSTHEELKEFDRKAKVYEDTVVEDEKRMSKMTEEKETSTPEKWLW